MPVFVIAPKNGQYDKVVSNIQEVKARDGKIIAILSTPSLELYENNSKVIMWAK